MFKRYQANQRAQKGTYWDMTAGEVVRLEKEGVLPGGPEASYVKAAPLVLLMLGPVGGLLYAIFLPFIGLFMLAALTTKKALAGAKSLASTTASFGWRPVEAYLAGQRRKPAARPKKDEGGKPGGGSR